MTDSAVPAARARHSDPGTSHDAAATVDGITHTHARILALFHHQGPLTDGDLIDLWQQMADTGHYPPISVSGLRTRRSELVAAARLVDTGRRALTAANRRTILWGLP